MPTYRYSYKKLKSRYLQHVITDGKDYKEAQTRLEISAKHIALTSKGYRLYMMLETKP